MQFTGPPKQLRIFYSIVRTLLLKDSVMSGSWGHPPSSVMRKPEPQESRDPIRLAAGDPYMHTCSSPPPRCGPGLGCALSPRTASTMGDRQKNKVKWHLEGFLSYDDSLWNSPWSVVKGLQRVSQLQDLVLWTAAQVPQNPHVRTRLLCYPCTDSSLTSKPCLLSL